MPSSLSAARRGHPPNAVIPLPGFAAFFSGVNARGLSEEDRYDDAQLDAELRPPTPVLVSASNADLTWLRRRAPPGRRSAPGQARIDWVHLQGVDHDLTTGRLAALRQALAGFVSSSLR